MKVVQESKGRNGELVSLVQDAMAHRTVQIVTDPPKKVYKNVEALISKNLLVDWDTWMLKDGLAHKQVVMNPKAITDSQMSSPQQRYDRYGYKDPISEEWNLNTVLDDNKILTLATCLKANNDRIPMTDNCKIVFEVQDLRNASPATVSRGLDEPPARVEQLAAGQRFHSELSPSQLDPAPAKQAEVDILKPLFDRWLKAKPPNSGAAEDFFDWCMRNIRLAAGPKTDATLNLLSASLRSYVEENAIPAEDTYRRILAWCIMRLGQPVLLFLLLLLLLPIWSKFAEILEEAKHKDAIPPCEEGQTIFEWVSLERPDLSWWEPEEWKPPKILNFSALLIPTMDSVRAEYILDIIAKHVTRTPPSFKSCMMVGAAAGIEAEIERKTGKTFCPPGGKKMTVFIDDAAMPLVNKWGDQITNELARGAAKGQLIEMSGFYFLDKDKRLGLGFWEVMPFFGRSGDG
ncbi:Dynein heavy chain 8, axonemal [Symbiodinium microadriaticum]|uniref:Dynein heavy chain 8, axonemal n=1 Tax=Symbiodinium microadriaticum TaxID=2951 RepID=A0A1Q9EA09_SYMMI|nr:Dynein heavy chain 8, axonemal [Symbiodinium microadriaticum]